MSKNLEDQFVADLDEVAEFLIARMGIQHSHQVDHLSKPLLRWLDFRSRYIDPKPREIFLSDALDRSLPESVSTGLAQFTQLAKDGADLNSFQSKTMVRFHDISGKDRKKRTDLLWADWGIHHLHVTDAPYDSSAEYMPRACTDGQVWLLFFMVFDDALLLIDVREHNEQHLFLDLDFLRILKRNWPAYMDRFRFTRNGVQEERHIEPEQRARLRSAGVMVPVVLDGEAFFGPGPGISSAATPMSITVASDHLHTWARQLAASVADTSSPIRGDARSRGVDSPTFSLKVCPSGLVVHESTLNIGYVLKNGEEQDDRVERMNLWMCPPWLLERLSSTAEMQDGPVTDAGRQA